MPISQVIKRLKEKYKFKWLRFSMSFHKFANFGELLNSDLNQKLMAGIEDLTHITRECNCNGRSKLDSNKCHYDEKCRHGCVVCSLECKDCDMVCIGKTQRHLKKRTQEHITGVWKVIES